MTGAIVTTLAVLALAVGLDRLLGEPPNALHPVAWFGRLVAAVDREWGDERVARIVGVAIALAFPLVAAGAVGWLVLRAAAVYPLLGATAAAVVLFATTSVRMLLDLTGAVVDASDADPASAREAVRGLVGRDVASLSSAEIRSAAVESAAENLADGFVATLLPFALLAPVSLPLAAGVAAWVKAVNTLDSMLGYPDRRIGTASARLDDAVMFLPARIAAAAIAFAALDPLAARRARRWARAPSSPNSGWPMATLACALDVRREKPGAYVLHPEAALPTAADGTRAVSVVGRAAALSVALAAVLSLSAPAIAGALAEVGP